MVESGEEEVDAALYTSILGVARVFQLLYCVHREWCEQPAERSWKEQHSPLPRCLADLINVATLAILCIVAQRIRVGSKRDLPHKNNGTVGMASFALCSSRPVPVSARVTEARSTVHCAVQQLSLWRTTRMNCCATGMAGQVSPSSSTIRLPISMMTPRKVRLLQQCFRRSSISRRAATACGNIGIC